MDNLQFTSPGRPLQVRTRRPSPKCIPKRRGRPSQSAGCADDLTGSDPRLSHAHAKSPGRSCAVAWGIVTDDPWRELEMEQARLRPDTTRAREYGDAHPLEFAGLRFVNEPAVLIEIGFTDHVDEHRAALTEIVSNPNRLRVIRAPYTATERAHAAAEVL